jgi:hypothetical protein
MARLVSPPASDHPRGGFDELLVEIRACRRCERELPLGPRPIVRGRPTARLLIISQAFLKDFCAVPWHHLATSAPCQQKQGAFVWAAMLMS